MPLRWGSKSPQAVLDDWTKQYPQLAIDGYDIVKILGYVWALRSGKINENQYDPGNWHISPGCGPWSPAEPANPWAGTGWKAGKDGSHANQHLQGRCGKATMDINHLEPSTEIHLDSPFSFEVNLEYAWLIIFGERNTPGWTWKDWISGLAVFWSATTGAASGAVVWCAAPPGSMQMKVGRWQKMTKKWALGSLTRWGPVMFDLYPPCILLSSLMSTLD